MQHKQSDDEVPVMLELCGMLYVYMEKMENRKTK